MTTLRASSLRHVRPARPIHFPCSEPEDERMGQSPRHHMLCAALTEILRAAAAGEHTVGADAFVYFDAADPRRCLAPDGFVKLHGPADDAFESYKAWEHGTPELAIEILSPSDSPERWTFEEKLERYHALGVQELVVFHVDGASGERLRAWDRLDGDLVERVVEGDMTACLTLGLTFVLAPLHDGRLGLRLARSVDGSDLVLTSAERADLARHESLASAADARAADAARQAAEAARRKAESARQTAEARVRELEAKLAEREG